MVYTPSFDILHTGFFKFIIYINMMQHLIHSLTRV